VRKLVLVAVVAFLLSAGFSAAPWQKQTYRANTAVARVIRDQSRQLSTGKLSAAKMVPLLRDKTVLFVEEDGTQVTVRDLAVTMLDEADKIGRPVTSKRTKLICGCKVGGHWVRYYVPTLTDKDFKAIIRTVRTQANR
jgi:hypothetical protein